MPLYAAIPSSKASIQISLHQPICAILIIRRPFHISVPSVKVDVLCVREWVEHFPLLPSRTGPSWFHILPKWELLNSGNILNNESEWPEMFGSFLKSWQQPVCFLSSHSVSALSALVTNAHTLSERACTSPSLWPPSSRHQLGLLFICYPPATFSIWGVHLSRPSWGIFSFQKDLLKLPIKEIALLLTYRPVPGAVHNTELWTSRRHRLSSQPRAQQRTLPHTP